MKKLLLVLAVALLLPAASGAAEIVPYCAPGPNSYGLALTDVRFGTNADGTGGTIASNCYGLGDKNLSDTTALQAINSLGWGEFGTVLKDEWALQDSGWKQSGDYWWKLSAPADEDLKAGLWTLEVKGAGPWPLTTDFAILLKGSNAWAAYLFQDYAFQGPQVNTEQMGIQQMGVETVTGWYTTVHFRPKTDGVGLSHMDLYLPKATPTPVPEPASMLLLGTGLLSGAAAMRRRRR